MANKNSFVLQTKLNAVVAKLSDKQAGVLFKGILNYAENGTVATFEDSAVVIAFEFVRQDIDYTAAKYAAICEKRKESIQKRWEHTKNTNVYKCITKHTNAYKAIHNDNDDDNELVDKSTNNKERSKKESSSKFIKPTLDDVAVYCAERKNSVSPLAFFDFYESKGWKIGSTPMRDWRAAVRTWERRDQKGGSDHGTDYNRNPEPNKYAGFGRKIEELDD